MFLLYDQQNSAKVKRIIGKGVHEDNVIVWSKNGIEFYYPREIMKDVFKCGDADLDDMKLDSNSPIVINGISKTKNELAEIVCSKLTKDNVLEDEFVKALNRIERETA